MEEERRSFPKERRLTKKAEFDLVMRNARGASDGTLVVYAKPLGEPSRPSRLGLVVGKKASPKATRRNRIKRRLREAFRLSRALRSGVDVVVVAKSDAPADVPFEELRDRLERLAARSLAKGPRR